MESGKQFPHLFGLENSNRDFNKPANWGKNIFNNTFPASLICYMHSINLQPVYLTLNQNGEVSHGKISATDLLGIVPSSEEIFFAFESDYVPYRPLVVDSPPRADLVVLDQHTNQCLSGLEIKLTALPDNSTYKEVEDKYGCELVVRPDTIIYLALSMAINFRDRRDELARQLQHLPQTLDWTDIAEVSPQIKNMADILDNLLLQFLTVQRPLVIQPVWKTQGRKLLLHQNALDVFVWSDFAFTRLFFRDAYRVRGRISRGARSIAWLTKMLIDFAKDGKIDYRSIIDTMSFNTKNDKAFAVNGKVTQPYMACAELTTPRITRDEIRNIILGGGEDFLSPERRLDAAILTTPGLFD